MSQRTVQLLIKQRKKSMISSIRLNTLFSRCRHTILHHRFAKCITEYFEGNYRELVYNFREAVVFKW